MPAKLFDDKPVVAPTLSADTGKPDAPPPTAPEVDPTSEIDAAYWERCLSDAERAEHDWRQRGREIIRIYRNDGAVTSTGKKKLNDDIVFNILYSNTEVMLPNIYSIPPQPVVRSRFVKKSLPPVPMPPPMMPPMGLPPAPPVGDVGAPPMGGPAGMPPPPVDAMGGMAPPVGADPLGQPVPPPMGGPPMMPPPGQAIPPESNTVDIGINLTGLPQPVPEPPPPPEPEPQMMAPGGPAPPPPGMPDQKDIETAASVMQKALEIVLDDDNSHEAIRAAVKDVLLPGRGTCRVRWHPQLKSQPMTSDPLADDIGAGPGAGMGDNGGPPMEDVKIWETVSDEYVYWEDILYDPVRMFTDGSWVAFRHLFDEKSLLSEFGDSPQLQALMAKPGGLSEILKWTEESAAKDVIGGGASMKTANKLGGVIKKAMAWEIWDRSLGKVIWFIREVDGLVLRVDPDSLGLSGFFPVPKPLLAVTTTDSMLPRPYYDLYKRLAQDLDDTSRRISQLTDKIKVRGGYNAANKDIAALLTADDGKMLPVSGVDLMSGGLQNHIWLVPIIEWVNALKELYLAREQIKQAIYEVMGISDIMRGSSSPYETATAQRIKGTMGTNRLDAQKNVCANFARELLRMKAEIIAKNFDASTLTRMTGEEVTPAIEAILRDDFQRTCSIDIETDSTVAVDEQVEQEGNAKIMMSVQGILAGAGQLLQVGVLPPPMIIEFSLELIKMMIHPIRNSRGVVEMINGFQEQLQAQQQAMAMMPPMPPMGGPPMPGGPPPGPPMPPGNGAMPPGMMQ